MENSLEIKNKLALKRYRTDYNDLCWIRRGVINDLYKIMLENGAFGEKKELSVPQQRKGLGSFLSSFYSFFKKN